MPRIRAPMPDIPWQSREYSPDSRNTPLACYLLIVRHALLPGEFKMTQSSIDSVFVSLIAGKEGEDRVALELGDGQMLLLDTDQARTLATKLITAVNRAEVKASLRVSTNLWRRPDSHEVRLSVAG